MKIRGISLDTVNKQTAIYADYLPGDVETLEDIHPDEDYTLMPTKEVAALVEAAEVSLDGDVDCNCDECSYLEYCGGCDGCNNSEEKYPAPLFGGAFYDSEGVFTYITKVIYDAPKTIVIWSDGTKTSSVCGEGDTYNAEMGLTLAVIKKLVSGEFVAKTLQDWAPNGKDTTAIRTLKDVRKAYKAVVEKA